MNLDELKFLLKKYHLTPNKIRGQNFLISDEVLEEIIGAAKLQKNDLVLEVGPGLGALTQSLLEQSREVVAFEVDKKFRQALEALGAVNPGLEIVWQDILVLTDDQLSKILSSHQKETYKLVANIPYYLTGKLIQKFVASDFKPLSMVLMIQEQVGARIVDQKKHSLLSLSVAFYAKSRLIARVPRDNFYPEPQVDSALIEIFDIQSWHYPVAEKYLWQIVRRGFSAKRKKLFNNLMTDSKLQKENLKQAFGRAKIDLDIRAERLTVQNWVDLVKNLK